MTVTPKINTVFIIEFDIMTVLEIAEIKNIYNLIDFARSQVLVVAVMYSLW